MWKHPETGLEALPSPRMEEHHLKGWEWPSSTFASFSLHFPSCEEGRTVLPQLCVPSVLVVMCYITELLRSAPPLL